MVSSSTEHKQSPKTFLSKKHGVVLLLAMLAVSGLACRRQETSVNGLSARSALKNGKKGGATGKSVLQELPDALQSKRLYFQSRSVISLNVTADGTAPGDTLSLLNDSTGAVLVEQQIGDYGLTAPEGEGTLPSYHLLSGPYELLLKIYPLDPAYAGKFSYGDNLLHLSIEGPNSGTFAKRTVHLHDGLYFSVATSVFPDTERHGGLEGQVSWLGGSITSNGSSLLETGAVPVLSR